MPNIKPIRIQRSRQHKQISPNGLPIKYVGRPGKFGNHWKVTPLRDAKTCVEMYEHEIIMNPSWRRTIQEELRGKNLSCWCKVGSPCHADVLLKYANS